MYINSHTFGERAGLLSQIVEEAITSFQSQKLIGYNTLESRAHRGTFHFPLGNAGDEEINIVH
jgi:hypothetical protein